VLLPTLLQPLPAAPQLMPLALAPVLSRLLALVPQAALLLLPAAPQPYREEGRTIMGRSSSAAEHGEPVRQQPSKNDECCQLPVTSSRPGVGPPALVLMELNGRLLSML